MGICQTCYGTGYKELPFHKACPQCGGGGRIGDATCWKCGGSGKSLELERISCSPCNGTGRVQDPVRRPSARPARPGNAVRDGSKAGGQSPQRPPRPAQPWSHTQTAVLLLAYGLSLWWLIRDGVQGWWPYLLAVVPAFIAAVAWKALLFLAAAGLAAWYALPYLYHLFDY